MREQVIKDIRESFSNHIATLTEFDGIQVVRWARPNTNNYSMNVIYQSNFIYISGDLGEAIYDCTWQTNYKNCSNADFRYLTGKLACVRGGMKLFDSDECVKDLMDWYNERLTELDGYEDVKEIRRLIDFLNSAESYTDDEYTWITFLRDADNDMVDFESPLYTAGQKLNVRLYYYWVALKMICEYLENHTKQEVSNES